MAHVKFRRWGPYVWWICPSRKCNFENKTDLSFVRGEFETKCQYCNTPITIKMSAGQLALEYSGTEGEETKPVAATPTNPPASTTNTQSPAPPASTATTPASLVPTLDSPASSTEPAPTTPAPQTALKDSEEPKKKGAS